MPTNFKTWFITAISVVIFVSFAALFIYQKFMAPTTTLQAATLAGVPLELTIVTTPAAMAQGLSGRPMLPANQGMLFVYPDIAQRHFWMKGMQFPLDILWLRDGLVVGMAEQVPVPRDADIPRITSPHGINQVLELTAGWVARYQVTIGDRLELLTD